MPAVMKQSRLWLGTDHLLAVSAVGYQESYKRFYFRDIQAVIVRRTTTGRTINQSLGPLAILSLAIAVTLTLARVMSTGTELGGGEVFWWIVGVALAGIVLWNFLLGPTCICHIRTAVQTEELVSQRRLRRLQKVLALVRPIMVAAQGQLAPEEITARMAPPPPVTTSPGLEPLIIKMPETPADEPGGPLEPPPGT
jgi:hypothetical protein